MPEFDPVCGPTFFQWPHGFLPHPKEMQVCRLTGYCKCPLVCEEWIRMGAGIELG